MVEVTVYGESTPSFINVDAIDGVGIMHNDRVYLRLRGIEEVLYIAQSLATVLERIRHELEQRSNSPMLVHERMLDRRDAAQSRISDLQHRQLMYRVSICALLILAVMAVMLVVIAAGK